MDVAGEPSAPPHPTAPTARTPLGRFVRTWRRELIRGAVLFGVVVGVGVAISSVRVDVSLPWAALRAFGDFDLGDRGDPGKLFGAGRETGDPWEFRTSVTPSQQIWLRNTNGPIIVMGADDNTLEVIAEKSWRHSGPEAVEMVAVPSERGITICALWKAREQRCEDGGVYRLNGVYRNDVAVRIHVRLPRGVRLDASTVNGQLDIAGVSAPVEATTVNGRVEVRTSVGPVQARTVNGAVEAVMQEWSAGDVELQTVNGSVTVALPSDLAAVLDAATVNGRVQTDLPVQVSGKISPRQLRGTIGAAPQRGATLPHLTINTVNGSITIESADRLSPAAAPRSPRPPRAGRAPRPPRPPRPAAVEQTPTPETPRP